MFPISTKDNLSLSAIKEAINNYKKSINPTTRRAPRRTNDYVNTFSYTLPTMRFISSEPRKPKEDKVVHSSRYLLFYFYEPNDSDSYSCLREYGGKINNMLDSISLFTVYDKDTFESWGDIKGKDKIIKEFDDFDASTRYSRFDRLKEIGDAYNVPHDLYPALLVYDLKNDAQGVKSFKGYRYYDIYTEIKDIIISINENYNNFDMRELGEYSENKTMPAIKPDFFDLYKKYTKKKGYKIRIANAYDVEYTTLYRKIQSGIIERAFSRDDLIIMAFSIDLTRFEANELIESVGYGKLNPNIRRDYLIINGLDNRIGLEGINAKLRENNFSPLVYIPKRAE